MHGRLAKLARLIGSECAQREFGWIMKHSRPLPEAALDRRIAGEPLQYILGTTPFGPLDLLARPPTLIPRPETEDWALRLARTRSPSPARPVRVLDLFTGSGCIPLLLCHLWPPGSIRAVGVDISPDAIRLAADNCTRSLPGSPTRPRRPTIAAVASNLRIPSEAQARPHVPLASPDPRRDGTPGRPPGLDTDIVDVGENTFTPLLRDVLDPNLLRGLDPQPPFDVITANPPYIPRHVYHTLPPSVKDWEDPRALIGDLPDAPRQDGLSFYHVIAALIAQKGVLARGAVVALEVGHDQAHAVQQILRRTPGLSLAQIEIWKDPWDKERVVFARAA